MGRLFIFRDCQVEIRITNHLAPASRCSPSSEPRIHPKRQIVAADHPSHGSLGGNVEDRNEPVQPDPVKSKTAMRIFELYAPGNVTFEALADRLADEGHVYRETM